MKKLMLFGDLDRCKDLDVSNDYLGIDITDLFSIKRSTEIFYDNSPECINPSLVINNHNFAIIKNEDYGKEYTNLKCSSVGLIKKNKKNKVPFLSIQRGGRTTCLIAKLESKTGIVPRYSYELLMCWDVDKIYQCSVSMQFGGVGSKVYTNYYFDLEEGKIVNRSREKESSFKVIDGYVRAVTLDSILKDYVGFSKLEDYDNIEELPCYMRLYKPETVRKVFLDLGLKFYLGKDSAVFEFFDDILEMQLEINNDLSCEISLISSIPSEYKEIKNPNLSYFLDCGKTICLMFPFKKAYAPSLGTNAVHCVLMYKRHVGLISLFPNNMDENCAKFHIMYNIRTGQKANTKMITDLEAYFVSEYPKLVKISNKL